MAQHTSAASDAAKHRLDSELRRLQIKTVIGFEVTVKWQPGAAEYGADGRKLAEIVRGNTIFIFSDNVKEAIGLTRHGFLEWILARASGPT